MLKPELSESWMRAVVPLAAETLGVRSSAVLVESIGGRVLLEPSFAVHPERFDLPPHPWELAAGWRARQALDAGIEQAATLIISHFHFDHMMAPEARPFEFYEPGIRRRLYAGKRILARSIVNPINAAQRERAKELVAAFPDIVPADGLMEDRIRFSGPIQHGEPGSKQGWTLCYCIETPAGRLAHGTDTQLMNDDALRWLLDCRPDVVVTSGPPLWLAARRSGKAGFAPKDVDPIDDITDKRVRTGLDRLIELARNVEYVVVDHHMARSEDFGAVLGACSERAGRRIYCVADWLGKPRLPLEAWRRQLHQLEPVPQNWYSEFAAGDGEIHQDLIQRSERLAQVLGLLEQ
jgi:predicted metallo-beta-lactamase superfamily hydrolase